MALLMHRICPAWQPLGGALGLYCDGCAETVDCASVCDCGPPWTMPEARTTATNKRRISSPNVRLSILALLLRGKTAALISSACLTEAARGRRDGRRRGCDVSYIVSPEIPEMQVLRPGSLACFTGPSVSRSMSFPSFCEPTVPKQLPIEKVAGFIHRWSIEAHKSTVRAR